MSDGVCVRSRRRRKTAIKSSGDRSEQCPYQTEFESHSLPGSKNPVVNINSFPAPLREDSVVGPAIQVWTSILLMESFAKNRSLDMVEWTVRQKDSSDCNSKCQVRFVPIHSGASSKAILFEYVEVIKGQEVSEGLALFSERLIWIMNESHKVDWPCGHLVM